MTRLPGGASTLSSLAVAAILSGCGAAEVARAGQDHGILMAAAEHVRSRTDAAFEFYLGEAGPRDYVVHLAPDGFPLPEVLGAVALRIGNATYGPIDTTCAGPTCRVTPDVPVIVVFKNLDLPRPDSATLELDIYIQPFEPVPYSYWRLDRFYLALHGEQWTVTRVEIREES